MSSFGSPGRSINAGAARFAMLQDFTPEPFNYLRHAALGRQSGVNSEIEPKGEPTTSAFGRLITQNLARQAAN
jgi:hypothetical protein